MMWACCEDFVDVCVGVDVLVCVCVFVFVVARVCLGLCLQVIQIIR